MRWVNEERGVSVSYLELFVLLRYFLSTFQPLHILERCNLPLLIGSCTGKKEQRFYFNVQTRQCESFTFGGGKPGNANNFLTRDECFKNCPVCPVPGCREPCPMGFKKNAKGCQTCECIREFFLSINNFGRNER